MDGHAVEDLPCQLARLAIDEAQMSSQTAELAVARPASPSEEASRIPPEIEARRFECRRGLLSGAFLGIDQRPGHLEMLVDRLARHEEVHDLGRAFEDLVDPVVAQDLLDRDRLVCAGSRG